MKTNSTAIKGFKAVDFMREVRDKISLDIQDMNFEEIRTYMEERRLKLTSINYSAPYTQVMESSVVSEPTTTPPAEVDEDAEYTHCCTGCLFGNNVDCHHL
jgi:hypothetical protein